jgi:hypothetical protein
LRVAGRHGIGGQQYFRCDHGHRRSSVKDVLGATGELTDAARNLQASVDCFLAEVAA